MTEIQKPENWTADYAWQLIDKLMLRARTQEISAEMHLKLAQAKAEAHYDGRKKGNSAFFPMEWARREELGAKEWAEKLLQAALNVWKIQGHEPCRPFFDAIYKRLIGPLFGVRQGAVSTEMHLAERRAGTHGRYTPSARSFARAMIHLDAKWKMKLAALAKEHEYDAKRRQEATPAEAFVASPAVIVTKSHAPSVAKKRKRNESPDQQRKRRVIYGALEAGLKAKSYCSELTKSGIRIPGRWLEKGCPSIYLAAYDIEKYRKYIQDEKCTYRREYKNDGRVERNRIIAGQHSKHS